MTPDEWLTLHEAVCDLGWRTCVDCLLARTKESRSLITVASAERDRIEPWVRRNPHICAYCGEPSAHRDHLLPKPWTGSVARTMVPTVPACSDCNGRLGATMAVLIAERAQTVAASLERKHRKLLAAPDWTSAELAELGYSLRTSIAARQATKVRVVERLRRLRAGGAVACEVVV